MVETDRHIGIILEYASGGELFDYILTHRYLKDPPACRLFAQLVSGVGYLHKKGIVHRDLKLENLLLDRNRNIIITDFGFANVFDPTDELGELEDRLEDPAVSKELEKGVTHTDRQPDGSSLLSIIGPGQTRRRGDLMATSCGSPCYAAPELVVSDGLYTGRKVDVWSCGVILVTLRFSLIFFSRFLFSPLIVAVCNVGRLSPIRRRPSQSRGRQHQLAVQIHRFHPAHLPRVRHPPRQRSLAENLGAGSTQTSRSLRGGPPQLAESVCRHCQQSHQCNHRHQRCRNRHRHG